MSAVTTYRYRDYCYCQSFPKKLKDSNSSISRHLFCVTLHWILSKGWSTNYNIGCSTTRGKWFFRNTMEDLNWIPIHTLHIDIWIYFVKCQNFLRFIFVIELDTWKSEKVHILYLYTNSIHSRRSLIMSYLVNLKIHKFLETPFPSVIHRNN